MMTNNSAYSARINSGIRSASLGVNQSKFTPRLNSNITSANARATFNRRFNSNLSSSNFGQNRPGLRPRIDSDLTTATEVTTAKPNLTGRNGNPNWTGRKKWSGNNTNGLAGNRNWSGSGKWSGNCDHHHHHHGCSHVVFVGGYYYPAWWYYPYSYSYYDYDPYYAADVYAGGGSDYSVVAELQQRLAQAGYYYGSIDGIMGPSTQRAIRAYERANGLPADGLIDDRLLSTMGIR